MAEFIELNSPAGNLTYFVNIDTVQYLQPLTTNRDHTMITFIGNLTLTVAMPAQDIVARAATLK
jgi:hypothetical protein